MKLFYYTKYFLELSQYFFTFWERWNIYIFWNFYIIDDVNSALPLIESLPDNHSVAFSDTVTPPHPTLSNKKKKTSILTRLLNAFLILLLSQTEYFESDGPTYAFLKDAFNKVFWIFINVQDKLKKWHDRLHVMKKMSALPKNSNF